ncbi:hypothetical protein RDI58_015742 [Solanum bulbocastanum]|uniref:Uncharacterized protein n=1 Tax=Solanum bulbocastanum TaxID=147425 RepID=A0AAN8TL24_SOLBU
MVNFWVFLLICFVSLTASGVTGSVILIGNNSTLSFEDIEANFAPSPKGSGKCGRLYVAEPLDACSTLTNKIEPTNNFTKEPFVLIIRGGCSFEDKVRKAQTAGFKAAIIYDSGYGDIIAMFISKASGEALTKYAGPDMEVWLIPNLENSAWSIMATSFISLLAMSAVLAMCFFVRRHHIRREHPRASRVREFHGISSRLVNAMPSLIFTSVVEDNSTSVTCAICLEDYTVGDKLRILPCRHNLHSPSTTPYFRAITSLHNACFSTPNLHNHFPSSALFKTLRTSTGEPPASESTPLLSSSLRSVSSMSSLRSSLASSAVIHIGTGESRSPSVSRPQSISSSHNQHSVWSYQSPHLTISRSSLDLQNASSQRSRAAYLISSNSLGYPCPSPLNSRYGSAYIPSPSNPSSSYMGSTSRQPNPLHHSESITSFSPFASANSLPGCES